MLKFEHSEERIYLETSGTLVDMLSDTTLMIGVLYKKMFDDNEEMADDFRVALVAALFDNDCPAWHPERVPEANRAVTTAPGLESLLAELASRKNEGDGK